MLSKTILNSNEDSLVRLFSVITNVLGIEDCNYSFPNPKRKLRVLNRWSTASHSHVTPPCETEDIVLTKNCRCSSEITFGYLHIPNRHDHQIVRTRNFALSKKSKSVKRWLRWPRKSCRSASTPTSVRTFGGYQGTKESLATSSQIPQPKQPLQPPATLLSPFPIHLRDPSSAGNLQIHHQHTRG